MSPSSPPIPGLVHHTNPLYAESVREAYGMLCVEPAAFSLEAPRRHSHAKAHDASPARPPRRSRYVGNGDGVGDGGALHPSPCVLRL